MKRLLTLLAAACALLAFSAPLAQAQFAIEPEVTSEAEGGGDDLKAGSHPFALVTEVSVKTEFDPDQGKVVPTGEMKDMDISFPQGLVGNPTAVLQCTSPDFLAGKSGECDDGAAVGVAEIEFGEPGKTAQVPVYNLEPTPATAARVGFIVEDRAPVTIEIGLNPDTPNNVVAKATDVSQAIFFFRAKVTIWGNPADPVHDAERGECRLAEGPPGPCESGLAEEIPFLTLPASCDAPLAFDFKARPWQLPRTWVEESASAGTPTECAGVEFKPEIAAQTTTGEASSPSGFDFDLSFDDPGLIDPDGRSQATIKRAEVTLPEGMTLNPGAANGLGSCSQAQLAEEKLGTGPKCPADSKVGEVEVETPLLEGRLLTGSIYVATPYENPFKSLFALYMVIREPELGILVKLPGKINPNPSTGQLTTVFGEAGHPIPQVPFSDFRFHFDAGPRAPLTTPPTCGTHTATAVFTPSSGNAPITKTASLAITSGPGGGPCQASLPFTPSFDAGSQSSTAGAFSPFYVRLTKGAGQQDLTRLSMVLPPGVTGKIAGLGRCSQAALDAARARLGKAELELPSCPADSRIGSIQAGAGSGSALTFVNGSLYLAGPYEGAPLSVAAVVPAVAGPFDLGNVVVQQGLDLNPDTAEVEVKGAPGSIPRFLQGAALALRDLRISVDRPDFVLNPTDCEPTATRASLTGTGTTVEASPRFQASNCEALGFKPKLKLKLTGQMKRSGNPAVTATLTPRAGDANVGGATVLLPKTMLVDNAHVNNPCTRDQFAAEQCPKSSVLGSAQAFTPLLDQPLEGKVYFRSNGGARELPDIVADLRGQFRIVLVGFIDARNARIRTRFLGVPDAPVSKFVLKMSGGKKGLLENTMNLCKKKQVASLNFSAQNGRRLERNQKIALTCKGKGKGGGKQGGKK